MNTKTKTKFKETDTNPEDRKKVPLEIRDKNKILLEMLEKSFDY
jgi:hypothetical protein